MCFRAVKNSRWKLPKWLISGPDKELVEALKQQAKRDSINRTPEQKEAIRKQQEEYARIAEIREAEIERLRAEEGKTAESYLDKSEEKWEMPYNLGLLFVFLILGGFGFLFWWTIFRKIRNNIRDLSYTRSEVDNKFNYAMNDSRFDEMSEEQRESVAKMKKFLNRKS